jgi:hypothetical protein
VKHAGLWEAAQASGIGSSATIHQPGVSDRASSLRMPATGSHKRRGKPGFLAFCSHEVSDLVSSCVRCCAAAVRTLRRPLATGCSKRLVLSRLVRPGPFGLDFLFGRAARNAWLRHARMAAHPVPKHAEDGPRRGPTGYPPPRAATHAAGGEAPSFAAMMYKTGPISGSHRKVSKKYWATIGGFQTSRHVGFCMF